MALFLFFFYGDGSRGWLFFLALYSNPDSSQLFEIQLFELPMHHVGYIHCCIAGS